MTLSQRRRRGRHLTRGSSRPPKASSLRSRFGFPRCARWRLNHNVIWHYPKCHLSTMGGVTRRSISSAVELDQSLRRSRAVYLVLSIIFVPAAILVGFTILLTIVDMVESTGIPTPYELVDLGLGSVMMFLAYSFVSSAREASRRLKQLVDDPSSNVRPMPVSFLESIFNIK